MSTYQTPVEDRSGSRPATRSELNKQCQEMGAGEAAMCYLRSYAKEKPETVALWALGVGFILGWKLRPW